MTTQPFPPEPDLIPCPECKGTGGIRVSDCCGAEVYSNGDSSTEDIGICPECRDYCGYDECLCEECDGTGEIPITDDDYDDDEEEDYGL